MFVATRKIISRLTSEDQGYEKLVANRFGVVTQGIPVAIRTRLLNKIYVATLSKYVATQSKSKPREQVATETISYDKDRKLFCDRPFYVSTKRPIWARILGIHHAINEVRPNIGNPINTHF